MTARQLDLSAFAGKTITIDESTQDFRPWDKTILDWEIEYTGYRRDFNEPEGYIEFHVTVEVSEAMVTVRHPKIYKKIQAPGYNLTVFQSMAFEGNEWETFVVHDEQFKKEDLKRAIDAFQRELLNIQSWVEIAESRARIIPQANDLFECMHCGWVTHLWADDIICQGCGKRYWSEKMWRRVND